LFSTVFIIALFGSSALKLLIIYTIHYFVVDYCDQSVFGPMFSWVYGLSLLFLNHYYNGYSFGMISNSLSWLVWVSFKFRILIKESDFVGKFHLISLYYE
jgi:hypothetical protein